MAELIVIKRVLVKILKLFLELLGIQSGGVDRFFLVLDNLSVFSVAVELPHPANFLSALLSGCLLLPNLARVVELFGYLSSSDFYLVKGCENLVADWPPSVVLVPAVPAIFAVLFHLVEANVD